MQKVWTKSRHSFLSSRFNKFVVLWNSFLMLPWRCLIASHSFKINNYWGLVKLSRKGLTNLLAQSQEALLQFSSKFKVIDDLLILRQGFLWKHPGNKIQNCYIACINTMLHMKLAASFPSHQLILIQSFSLILSGLIVIQFGLKKNH